MPAYANRLVTTSALQRGDRTTYGEVAEIDRKVKWATVTFTDGTTQRVLLTEEWGVSRLESTAEEIAARRLDAKLQWLDRTERTAITNLPAVREKAANDLLAGKAVTSWNLLEVVEAQALAGIWEHVRRASAYQVERPEDEQLTRIEVLQNVRQSVEEKLLNYMQLTSRSTSQASNLVEDCEREVQLRWLRDTRGFGEL